jgi:hypothetical protein
MSFAQAVIRSRCFMAAAAFKGGQLTAFSPKSEAFRGRYPFKLRAIAMAFSLRVFPTAARAQSFAKLTDRLLRRLTRLRRELREKFPGAISGEFTQR